MKPTKDMIGRAKVDWDAAVDMKPSEAVESMLSAALDGYELGFELSIDGARLLDPSKGPFMAPEIRERVLLDELHRAQRVLVAKPAAVELTPDLERVAIAEWNGRLGKHTAYHEDVLSTVRVVLAKVSAPKVELSAEEADALRMARDTLDYTPARPIIAALLERLGHAEKASTLDHDKVNAALRRGAKGANELSRMLSDAARPNQPSLGLVLGAAHAPKVNPVRPADYSDKQVRAALQTWFGPNCHHYHGVEITNPSFECDMRKTLAAAGVLAKVDAPKVSPEDYSEAQISAAAKIASYYGVREDNNSMVRRILAAAGVPACTCRIEGNLQMSTGCPLHGSCQECEKLQERVAELEAQLREQEERVHSMSDELWRASEEMLALRQRAQKTEERLAAQGSGEWTEEDYKAANTGVANATDYGRSLAEIALDAVSYRLRAPEPVKGPFVLSEGARDIVRRLEQGSEEPYDVDLLVNELQRAERTLAPAALEPLSDELRETANSVMRCWNGHRAEYRVAAELLRRCPEPEPTRPTVAELKHRVFTAENIRTSKVALESFEEIVRLAERTESDQLVAMAKRNGAE